MWDKECLTENVWLSIADLNNTEGKYISNSKERISEEGKQRCKPVKEGTLLVSFKLTLGRLAIAGRELYTNEAIAALSINDEKIISREYLYYYLHYFDWDAAAVGKEKVKGKTLNKAILKTLEIRFPSLNEQKRIVSILDEAFAKIHNSKEKLQQKLAGAKEIYFSVIHSQDGDKAPLGNFVDIKTGKLNSNAAVEGGQYPFFTCSRKPSDIDHYAFDCEAILLAGNNASGDFNVKHYSGKFNAYQRTYVITISDKEKLTYRYLYHQMVKSLKELKSSSVGTGTKFLKLGMIKDLQINVPSLEKQLTLQGQIDGLENESEKLEKNYLCELEMVDELKQSILQKSFNGNL